MTRNDLKFTELYDRHYRHVFAYCRRRVALDRVEDSVADVFLTAWRRIEDVPADREALLWLYRVCYRVVGRVWRSTSRHHKLTTRLMSLGVESHPPAEDFVISSHEERQVVAAASRLLAKDEEVLRLAIWEQLSGQEIASVLGISSNAVRQRLHRAKKNLHREYMRIDNEDKSHAAQEGGAW